MEHNFSFSMMWNYLHIYCGLNFKPPSDLSTSLFSSILSFFLAFLEFVSLFGSNVCPNKVDCWRTYYIDDIGGSSIKGQSTSPLQNSRVILLMFNNDVTSNFFCQNLFVSLYYLVVISNIIWFSYYFAYCLGLSTFFYQRRLLIYGYVVFKMFYF